MIPHDAEQLLVRPLVDRRIHSLRLCIDLSPQVVRRVADMPHLCLFVGFLFFQPDGHLAPRSRLCIVPAASSFKYHLESAKKNGVTRTEIAEILTHAAFYAGWPKAWAAFRMAKEVWTGGNADSVAAGSLEAYAQTIIFPVGKPNDAYAKYFIGQSYTAPVVTDGVPVVNVTFEPGCRNNWHVHKATKGGGQTLVCVGGRGYYQEWGKEPVELHSGDAINIPAGVKHWHGAAPDSWFSHLAIEVPGENNSTEWLEPVGDEEYAKLK